MITKVLSQKKSFVIMKATLPGGGLLLRLATLADVLDEPADKEDHGVCLLR
jgi:hypothetical protein